MGLDRRAEAAMCLAGSLAGMEHGGRGAAGEPGGRLGSHSGDLFTPAAVSAQHTCASAWDSLLTGPLDAGIRLVPLGAGPSKGL